MGDDSINLRQKRTVEVYDEAFTFVDKWRNSYKFTQIPTMLLQCQKHLKLKDRELILLLQLLSHWYRSDKDVFPSIARLAKFSGKSYSTVQKGLVNLELKGFVMIDHKLGYSSTYDLNPCVRQLENHVEECPHLSNN